MATHVDGVGASSALDKSSERLDISGLDTSSLEIDGVFTWEHDEAKTPTGEKLQIKIPGNVVGKILKAKKIFSEADCEGDREKYYWDKTKCPFVYVMGVLFDDYTASGKEVAGMFRYDADHRHVNKQNVLGFSVEGGKMPGSKVGVVVNRAVARKITITVHPCNAQCIAELIPNPKAESTSDIDSLFKSYSDEVSLFKTEVQIPIEASTIQSMQKSAEALGIHPMNKTELPTVGTPPMTEATHGPHLGNTKSGKSVFGTAKVHDYKGFSATDHQQAATLHHTAAKNAGGNAKDVNHHLGKMSLHLQASKTMEDKGTRFARGKTTVLANRGLAKSLDAGSGSAAPGTLTGGAALVKESIVGSVPKKKKKDESTTMVSTQITGGTGLTKSEWLARSEQEYLNWPKKEAFVQFMKSENPYMTPTEVDCLGKALALSECLKMEEKLAKLVKKTCK